MLAFLWLGISACGPAPRRVSRTVGRPVVVEQAGDSARQLEQIEAAGPRAKSDRAALVQLGRELRNPRHDLANRASYWLSQSGRPAVPILIGALADSSPLTRTSAAYGLGLIGRGAQAAVPALTLQLAGASDSAANMADWALTQIDPRTSASFIPLLRALRYGTTIDRADAALRLALLGEASADAIPVLIRSLADTSSLVAESASEALVRIGSRSVPAVEAALRSENPTIRARAVLVLGRIRPQF